MNQGLQKHDFSRFLWFFGHIYHAKSRLLPGFIKIAKFHKF